MLLLLYPLRPSSTDLDLAAIGEASGCQCAANVLPMGCQSLGCNLIASVAAWVRRDCIEPLEAAMHDLAALLGQLGLADGPEAISQFIQAHSPLDPMVRIEEAPFWTPAQAEVLRACLLEDADWADAVDRLNLALRLPYREDLDRSRPSLS